MGFDYDRKNKHANQDSMWTSYSDLFLGLSVIFLLLYVTASLRQGTDGVRQYIENRQLAKDNDDLKQQLKVYNSLKQNYLETQAAQDEQQTYDTLMGKLELLQDEANQEKTKLEQAAAENGKKEKALNQYQQIVRNIINANLLSKARIKNRDVLITKKEGTIEEQTHEITGLEKDLNKKRNEIEKSENKIAGLESTLGKKLKELEHSYRAKKMTERKFKEKQEALKRETERRVASLRDDTERAQKELYALGQQLKTTSSQLSEVEGQKTKLAGDLSRAKGDLDRTKGDLNQAKGDLDRTQGDLNRTKGDLSRTKGDLAVAQENLNARRKLADSIKGKFNSNGVHAEVDGKTGDVLLSFEGEYFNTGEAKLKNGMKKVLEKAMPAYAQSLFEDPKISEKIENVEIVGFASPTYKGKWIDPSKLSAQDRQAVNYNLDLSYGRARSIFDHVFTKMSFQHKQRLLPLVKVTGRSFLGDKQGRNVSSEDGIDGCKALDCAKKQTVIIKFKLKD